MGDAVVATARVWLPRRSLFSVTPRDIFPRLRCISLFLSFDSNPFPLVVRPFRREPPPMSSWRPDWRPASLAPELVAKNLTPGATGMDDALRDALMIEVGDLFAKDEIFPKGRATKTLLQ